MQKLLRLAAVVCLVGLSWADAKQGVASSFLNGISSVPLLSGGSPAVWQGSDGDDLEIYYSNGTQTTQLTDNDFDDSLPQQSGTTVVWQGWDGNDWEIFQFDAGITTQLTNNSMDDVAAHFSQSEIKWQGWDGNDWEVFQYDGMMTIQLTDNTVDDRVLFAYTFDGGTTGGDNNSGEPLGSSVPEPSTLALVALGFVGLVAWAWRRRKA